MKNVMNLTPEEKFNQEVWWILQEIKKEQLATPKGEKVYFSLRVLPKTSSIRRKNVDYGFPQADTQRKLLYKLREWKALDLEPSNLNFDDLLSSPIAYLLTIFKKFDELYRTYKIKNQKVETEDEEIEKVLKSPPPLLRFKEEIIDRLYKQAKKLPKSGLKQKCIFFVAQLGDNDEQETVDEFLNLLKKEGVVVNYDYKYSDEEGYASDGSKIEWEIILAECELYTDKLFNYIKKIWQPKKEITEKLAKNYLNLIRIIELYFKNPQNRDSLLNKFYLETCAEIGDLIYHKDLSPRLQVLYKKPFDSLFSAEKELQENKTKLKDILNSLNAFYGEIHKLLAVYDISDEPENEIEKIENYIGSLESREKVEKKKNKKSGELTTKLEITKMPELKIKKLEKLSKSNKKTNEIDYQMSFNEDKSVLSIYNKNVKIQKFSDQYHLLRIVFEDELKDWQFSEIAELIDSEKSFKWKNLYNSANEIKKKIAIETGIKDFFITTTQSIKINEKYLKKS